jgi:phage portal protein BeeE
VTNLLRSLTQPAEERTDFSGLNLNEWVSFFNYNNINYPIANMRQTLLGSKQELGADYGGLASGAYQGNTIVFACMLVRALHFSEARFQWRQMRGGRPGNLFGTPDLALLETPWPNGTTGDLLARMIQDVDLAGNSYTVKQGDRLARLRPDWVVIMLGPRTNRSDWVAGDADTEVRGYLYFPGGRNSGHDPITYSPVDVAHFTESPDPLAVYRGSSWLSGLSREIMADSAMTAHKLAFFENGATTNMVVQVTGAKNQQDFQEWVQTFREAHVGRANAFAPVFLSGADVTPVGSDLQQIDFKSVQGAGELRIASAARVPPVLLGLSEGLQGSTLNSGNFNSSRRMFADGWCRPSWRKACGALQTLLNVPSAAALWYDDRDIPFLKEDIKEAAEAISIQMASIRNGVDSGFKPDTVVAAVTSGDLTLLEHSEMFSVQLQAPGVAQTKPGLKGQLEPLTGGTASGGTAMAPANGTNPVVPAK